MPKFSIMIHGRHFKLETEESKWFFFKQSKIRSVGFYATRFIEAPSANEAIEKALARVGEEIATEAQSTERSLLELNRIEENEEAFEEFAPGGGFSFYTIEDDP